MKVKATYIVQTGIYDLDKVWKIMYETTDGLYFLSGHIVGQVYQITTEQANELKNEKHMA